MFTSICLLVVVIVMFLLLLYSRQSTGAERPDGLGPAALVDVDLSKADEVKHGKQGTAYIFPKKRVVAKVYNLKSDERNAISFFHHWMALRVLSGHDKHFPVLLRADPATLTVYTSYEGKPLSQRNAPSDWKAQVQRINDILKEKQAVSVDTSVSNLCVRNGKLKLVDLGSLVLKPTKRMYNKEDIAVMEHFLKTGEKRKRAEMQHCQAYCAQYQ